MKKIIALGISFLVIVTITVFGYKIIEDAVQQAELRKGYEKLPDLVSLPLVDSSSYSLFNLSDEKGILVTHFSTECAFCESELNSVLDHGNLVAAASILLISTQPDSQLQQAKKKWNLHQYPDIYGYVGYLL